MLPQKEIEMVSIPKSVLDSMQDAFIVKRYQGTRMGTYVFINQHAADKLGKPVDQIIDQTDFDLMPPNDAQVIYEADLQVVNTGTAIHDKEHKIIMPDGKEIYESVTRTPWVENGEVVGVIVVKRDITVRKQIEQLMICSLLNYAHDIKGQVCGIKGFSQLITLGATDDPKSAGAKIDEAADEAALLCNEMYQKGKSMQDGIIACKTTCDYRLDIIDWVLHRYADNLEGKLQIDESILPKPGEVTLCVDKDKFRIIFSNAIHNFIKYEGGPVLRLGYRNIPDQLQLYLAHNNNNLPDKDKALMFKKNKEDMIRPENKGSGWGLVLCSDIVKCHDGTIECVSSGDNFLEIRINLPL